MKVIVKNLTSKKSEIVTIKLEALNTIAELKTKIAENQGIKLQNIVRIVFYGKSLRHEEQTAAECDIQEGITK